MLNPKQISATIEPLEISPEEVQAEIQSVLHSGAFERSEKLQKFLRYICDLTIRGEGGRINEYLIGSEVFLRGPEYSPSEDSVVRRQAHTLRQKLQEYYAGEGSTHALRIDLPVGRYVPSFRRVKESQPTLLAPVVVEPGASQTSPAVSGELPARGLFWAMISLAALALLAAGFYIGLYFAPQPFRAAIGTATNEIWGPWIQQGRRTIICFSSPMTAVIKHFDQPLPPDTIPKRMRAHPDEEALFHQTFRIPPGGAFYFTPTINQTKVGEAVSGVQLASLLTRLHIPVQTTQSRFVSWDDLRGDDLILLGNNETNQWLDPLMGKSPFRITPSAGKRQRAIFNAKPRPGEPSEYVIDYGAEEREGDQEYALISMLPGLEAKQRLLLISGLNAPATQAAAEYLSSETSLAELIVSLRKESPLHTGPWYFQAVLKAEVHDKVPTKSRLIAVRVL